MSGSYGMDCKHGVIHNHLAGKIVFPEDLNKIAKIDLSLSFEPIQILSLLMRDYQNMY